MRTPGAGIPPRVRRSVQDAPALWPGRPSSRADILPAHLNEIGVPMTSDPARRAPERTVPEQRLLMLRAPSANRVYAAASAPLAVREAERVLSGHLGTSVTARTREIAGVEHLELRGAAPREAMVRAASTLSSAMALFEPVDVDGRELLEPIALADVCRHPSDLETTLRYPGKTNEQFTALLVNLAAAASERRDGLLDGSLTLLDPMCGRGTTLSRALRLGLSPVGADVDKADHEAYRAFLTTWMRTHRLKHTSASSRLTVSGRVLGARFDAELARDKAAQRAGETQALTLLRCDAGELLPVLGRGRIDVIVTDLPYGVQHGSHGPEPLARSPLGALARVLPAWRELLRRDGAMALAINRRTAPFDEAASVLADAGFTTVSADGEFRHRVDQSIDRDVLVAVRTDHPRAAELREESERAAARPSERIAP